MYKHKDYDSSQQGSPNVMLFFSLKLEYYFYLHVCVCVCLHEGEEMGFVYTQVVIYPSNDKLC